MLRLIRMWLKAGVMEDGVSVASMTEVPHGGSISPLLSNIYGYAPTLCILIQLRRLERCNCCQPSATSSVT